MFRTKHLSTPSQSSTESSPSAVASHLRNRASFAFNLERARGANAFGKQWVCASTIIVFYRFLDCVRKLIRTGGSSPCAVCAFQTFYYIFRFHSLNERGNSFRVAVAAADELYRPDDSVFYLNVDLTRASAAGHVCDFFFHPYCQSLRFVCWFFGLLLPRGTLRQLP